MGLARVATSLEYDLLLCGQRAEDAVVVRVAGSGSRDALSIVGATRHGRRFESVRS